MTLFYFGLFCLVLSLIFLVLSRVNTTQLYGVSAWFKPFKFAFSIFLFVWAMGWYCHYLLDFNQSLFNWSVVVLLGFEIVYIAIMSAQGTPSHYNLTSPIFSLLFSLMALAASLVTLYTAYVGWLFFTQALDYLPDYYLWSIRLSIIIFVLFAFEGFLMGSRLSHTVGLVNDNSDLFVVGWSKKVGDLRIAHFIGMHALQLLPVLSYYVLKNTKITLLVAGLYLSLALFTAVQALKGKSLFPSSPSKHEIIQ